MSATTTPNPATVFGNRKPALIAAPVDTTEIAAPHDPTTHDGIVKAKHLGSVKGQEVRAYLNGAPRGGVRVVGSVERIDDGAMVRITWSSAHTPSEHKAAYRWFVPSLVGTPIKPASKRRSRKPQQIATNVGESLSDETRAAFESLAGAL